MSLFLEAVFWIFMNFFKEWKSCFYIQKRILQQKKKKKNDILCSSLKSLSCADSSYIIS